MLEADVIIVGAGPAGSACAWKLNQNGIQPVLLDKKAFPTPKTVCGMDNARCAEKSTG